MQLFSARNRPPHLGPWPLERLTRSSAEPALHRIAEDAAVEAAPADALSLAHAMGRYAAMFDVVRDGGVNPLPAEVSSDEAERARHLKAAAYYFDASMVGICRLQPEHLLAQPRRNPAVAGLADELQHNQPQSFAAGMDMILADVLDSARMAHGPVAHHTHVLVLAVAWPREPRPGEPGTDWLAHSQHPRAAVLAAQTAVLLSTYLRLLGAEARAHTATASELWLNRVALSAGLCHEDLHNPYLGVRYSLAAVSTTFAMEADKPLAAAAQQNRRRSHGLAWQLGMAAPRGAPGADPFATRAFHQGPHPFETLARRDEPTTLVDHARIPRFPKRADFFARALFGDLGREVQEAAKNAHYVMKSPIGACARRALGALLLLQFGDARGPVSASTADPARNALNLKGAAYFLGIDAAGLCAVPEWAWYSHDAGGNVLPACHANAVNLLVDQGYDTMEGASGDDWISVAQSMRAYLRFSLLGGILAEQVRRLGYSARVHSVLDGDVLQPPLLLLSGLGEVSRIGEVILNPFLGPRLKSGTVTTNLPMAYDKPIDFGLQRFCEQCQKCARECPSGAITAGPKVVYNGYEIWKSDAEKCARYRITNAGGGMCGRCMKTCPWNLEGRAIDGLWRWLAMQVPGAAKPLAQLDDHWGRGGINPAKTWWWDIELHRATGRYVRAAQTHRRGLQPHLRIHPHEQVLAVYPADRMPPPLPVAHPVNREEGIARYRQLLTPAQYRQRLAQGHTEGLVPAFKLPSGEPPVFAVRLAEASAMGEGLARYELRAMDGTALPAFEAGAHIDVVIAPEYLRAYSLAGNPADHGRWLLGVQLERPAQGGRGGSALMHRAFRPGRTVWVSRPRNHFPLREDARFSHLFAGGIGITPLLAMAHRLHALGHGFTLHYSVPRREAAAFVDEIEAAPWRERVRWHVSAQGGRIQLGQAVPAYVAGEQLYTCGSPHYMRSVFEAAVAQGWPPEALHREYFTLPEAPPRVNHPFTLHLLQSGRRVEVGAQQRATEALAAAGLHVAMKCEDGLCGVCAVGYEAAQSGPIEHRDVVLDSAGRQQRIVLCCSRAAQPGGVVALRL